MAVNFVCCRLIQFSGFFGIGCGNVFAFNYPDAYAFLPAGINIPCIFYGHNSISCMQAANMFMIKALFAANENFPERPTPSAP